ncbi:MAG: hypothetical protein IPL32_16025 [Chloracidobacterium sp.]|nr:hypothetical protein [Chloracidobacterium sp.]
MRIRFTYLFPLFYFVLSVLGPFLGPVAYIIVFLGMPLTFIANDWYIKYGDPTFVAILGGTLQWLIIGLFLDLFIKYWNRWLGPH